MTDPPDGSTASSAHAPGSRYWRDVDGRHIDVRGLAPPEPLVAILRLVRAAGDPAPLIVHHDRDPKLLYAELAEIGWIVDHLDGDAGEVRLLLRPGP